MLWTVSNLAKKKRYLRISRSKKYVSYSKQ